MPVFRFVFAFVLILVPSIASAQAPASKIPYGKLPLRFEKNQGQTDSQVHFLARSGSYTLFLTSSEAVFVLTPPGTSHPEFLRRGKRDQRKIQAAQGKKTSVLRMKLSGGNVTPAIEGVSRLPGTVNYLIGRNRNKWHPGIPTFGSVRVSEAYPGVDMLYYGNERQLEYDFVVKPGADPTKIAFEFEGADGVSLGETGEVRIDSRAGRLTVRKPSIYQMEKGVRKPIDGKFVMRDGRSVRVEMNSYDHTKSLVIDPVLAYSTYLGGSNQDLARGIAVDAQGNAYVAGYTDSVDFPAIGSSLAPPPTANQTSIAFVSKLDQSGTGVFYSTYFGGSTQDVATGVAVDINGQAYVVGATSDADFPVTNNAFQTTYESTATSNAYLAKLSSDGQSLLYSSYLGGGASDVGMGLAVDANQNAYLTGSATSSDFPITSAKAFQATLNSANGNAFLARIDTTQSGSNSLIYSTFLGGSSPYSFTQLQSGDFGGDAGLGIAIDSNQNAYIVGEASSVDFPITAGTAYQTSGNAANSAFLAKLNTTQSGSSSLVYSTFLGGTGSVGDVAYGIAVDSSSNPYVVGNASSANFPTTTGATNNGSGKAFAAKFNTSLSGSASLVYGTLIGGSVQDFGFAIAVDANGDASLAGGTFSPDFPVTSGALQSTVPNTSSSSGYIATLSPDGTTLLYSTYFGGSGTTFGDYVNALTTDGSASIYFAGQTDSTDIPTTQGGLQTSLDGQLNGFVGKLAALVTPTIASLSPLSGAVSTSVTITGQDFGAPQAGTVTFNGVPASPTTWNPTSIQVPVPSGANTGNVVVTVGNLASNGVAFTVSNAAPTIFSANPNAAPVGSQIQITGANFGSSQQNSIVSFNSVVASPSSWSDSAIGLPVPQGATTGTVTVQVGGVTSNAVNFAVANPPAITASVSPAPNSAGWNDSVVTVTFVCTVGDSPLASCPSPQTVNTAGTNQVFTGTVVDTVGLSASTSVTLNIEKIPPTILDVSPADQSVLASATGSINGKVVNSLTSVTGVTCNGASASFGSGNFSCNFSLNTGVNLVMVIATDVAGNTAGTRLHLIYSATLPAPTSLQITPATANVLVGATQQFTAVDQNGTPRTDATWTVDNTNIAAISTDASPILTGVAAGTVTLTASIENVSAQIQVNVLAGSSLSFGTTVWTAPSIPGYTLSQIFQAAPTTANTQGLIGVYQDSNSDLLFASFTGDGQELWQSSFSSSQLSLAQAIPDNLGGLVIFGSGTVVDIDGQTGGQVWRTNINYAGQPAAAPDGGTYIYQLTVDTPPALALVKLDPQSGQPIQLTTVPYGTENLVCNGIVYPPLAYIFPGVSNNPVVDNQGNVFFESSTLTDTETCPSSETKSETGSVIKIAPDGTVSTFPLFSYSQTCSGPGECPFGSDSVQGIVPDSQGGAFALWNHFPPGENDGGLTAPSFITNTTTSTTYQSPLSGAFVPIIVRGENGSLIESDGTAVVALGAQSGSTQWTYESSAGVATIDAVHGGGITLFDSGWNQISLDSQGNPSAPISLGSPRSLQVSLSGQVYGISSSGTLGLVFDALVGWADGDWDGPAGGGLANGESTDMPWFQPLQTCPGAQKPCAGDSAWTAFKSLQVLMAGPSCSSCNTFVFSKLGRTQGKFNSYLNMPPLISDGTASFGPMNHVMCDWWDISCPFGSETVREYMGRKSSAAISRTPSKAGVVIYINPASVCTAGTAPGTLLNEAMLFHEALHGFTGLYDSDLANALGANTGQFNINTQGSAAITYYIESHIFGATLTYQSNPGSILPICKN
jgi:hypothetical protein